MRRLTSILLALALPTQALADAPLHLFKAIALSPDGQHVASIESDDLASDTEPPTRLLIRTVSGGAVVVPLPCGAAPGCIPSSPSWNHDGSRLAFLLEQPGGLATDIMSVPVAGGTPTRLLAFPGPLGSLRTGPDDRLAVLATPNAHKRVGATQAAAPLEGEVGSVVDEQRIAIVSRTGGRNGLRFVSPADLYVYEFDWRPDGGFVGTGAHGNGDSNWWVAKLYAFDPDGAARILFSPTPRQQLATPIVSPDGRQLAFIGGWMSDFGSTGGDAYLLPLGVAGAVPRNLTPGLHATVTSLDWHCGAGLTAVTLAGGTISVATLAAGAPPRPLWSGDRLLTAGGWNQSLSCGGNGSAAIAERFTSPPELVAGPIGAWRPITHANAGLISPGTARSIAWRSDGLDVQGWLLEPNGVPAGGGRPLIVDVHGGPEAAALPNFPSTRDTIRALLGQGWDVLLPNYRGSFGQGEAFAAGSIRDIGGGDWRDVLGGVDAAEHAAAIDDRRLGITGGSYGGYMTMWAVTQTHRFRAGVADAGVSDWLSIEGEAPQAGSDEVNFGGSVYADAAPYLKASPVTHMIGVTTPVLVAVGAADVECPMPQSQEFYMAMLAQKAPVRFVVYPGEGHHLRRQADRDDLQRRTIDWFSHWFATQR